MTGLVSSNLKFLPHFLMAWEFWYCMIPKTYMVERDNSHKLFSGIHTGTMTWTCPFPYKLVNKYHLKTKMYLGTDKGSHSSSWTCQRSFLSLLPSARNKGMNHSTATPTFQFTLCFKLPSPALQFSLCVPYSPTSHFHLSLCAPVSLFLPYSSACWSSVSFHKPNSWRKYSRKQKSSSSRTYSYFGGSVGWNTPIRDHCLGVCVYILMSSINTFLVKYTLDIFRILITQTYGAWQNIVWWNISILILNFETSIICESTKGHGVCVFMSSVPPRTSTHLLMYLFTCETRVISIKLASNSLCSQW